MNKNDNFLSKENFKFVLYLNDEPVSEIAFPADAYNQYVRYSVNIKDIAGEMIKKFQTILSTTSNKLNFEYCGYNLLKMYKDSIPVNISFKDTKLYRKSEGSSADKGYYTNPDEQFKFILYVNDNHVIERNFFIKKFNPESRFSVDLLDYMLEISDSLQIYLAKKDVENMYEEFDIKKVFNKSITEIRTLNKFDRDNLLKQIYNN